MIISNNTGFPVTITRFFAYWPESSTTQKLTEISLDGTVIWNSSDPDSPSDIPSENPFVSGATRTVPAGVATLNLQFQEPVAPNGYEVHVVFSTNCQVIATK
jgi:hypothetical protein